MSLIFWDTHDENSIVAKYEHHTEFVLGCDFNLFQENLIASCAWDETVTVWNLSQSPR